MAENRCVCCGEIVPEGRQVCPTCEARASVPKYDPDEFFHHKRQTNADSIRAMSDEELAEWLNGMHYSYCCPNDGAHDCRMTCFVCWLDWLQQEVDTNDN